MPRKLRDSRGCSAWTVRCSSSTARCQTRSPKASLTLRRRASPSICGRPQWTSSPSINRIMRRTGGSWEGRAISADLSTSSFRDAPLGAGPESILTMVAMDSGLVASRRPGMTKALFPHPFRRALFGKCLRPLDIILRRHHTLYGRVLAPLGHRLFQRDLQALLDGLLGSADRHRRVLADRLGPAFGSSERFAGRHHLVDEAELMALFGRDM